MNKGEISFIPRRRPNFLQQNSNNSQSFTRMTPFGDAQQAPQKKSKKPLLAIIAAAVLLVIIIVVAVVMLGGRPSKKTDAMLDAKSSISLLANLTFSGEDSTDYKEPDQFYPQNQYTIDKKADELDKDYFGRLNGLLDNVSNSEYANSDYAAAKNIISAFAKISDKKIDPIAVYSEKGKSGVYDEYQSRLKDVLASSLYDIRSFAQQFIAYNMASIDYFIITSGGYENGSQVCYDVFGCMSEEEAMIKSDEYEDKFEDSYSDYYSYQNTVLIRAKTAIYSLAQTANQTGGEQ